MFKRFNASEDVAGRQNVKSSVQRGIRTKLTETYPNLEQYLEEIIPKKSQLTLVKCREHLSLLTLENEVLFVQRFDEPYIPSLRLVHKYPDAFTQVQVDRGAIKFVLSGANIMHVSLRRRLTNRCPGLTSKGARMEDDIPMDAIVAVMAEGKEHALAVGLMKMSSGDIRSVNKGIGVETLTYLGDPLWQLKL